MCGIMHKQQQNNVKGREIMGRKGSGLGKGTISIDGNALVREGSIKVCNLTHLIHQKQVPR